RVRNLHPHVSALALPSAPTPQLSAASASGAALSSARALSSSVTFQTTRSSLVTPAVILAGCAPALISCACPSRRPKAPPPPAMPAGANTPYRNRAWLPAAAPFRSFRRPDESRIHSLAPRCNPRAPRQRQGRIF